MLGLISSLDLFPRSYKLLGLVSTICSKSLLEHAFEATVRSKSLLEHAFDAIVRSKSRLEHAFEATVRSKLRSQMLHEEDVLYDYNPACPLQSVK